MTMARKEIVAAAVLLTFAAWYAYLATGLPQRSLPNTPGPSFFPWLIFACLALLSLALLGKGLVRARARSAASEARPVPKRELAALVSFAIYLALLPGLGFILASVAFFAVLMVLYGARNPAVVAAASVVVPIALFALFRYGFQIILPRGIFSF